MGGLSEKLDENPQLKMLVLGGLGLLCVAILYLRVLAPGGEEAVPPATPPGAAAPGAVTPAPGASPDAAPEAGELTPDAPAPGATADGAGKAAPIQRGDIEAGDGLPKRVVKLLEDGKGIVLVITQRDGVLDPEIRKAARGLERDRKDVELISVPLEEISDYARITRGIEVSRVPAVVVVAPGQPLSDLRAVIRQGYVDHESIVQAVDDAEYTAGQVPSFPHR